MLLSKLDFIPPGLQHGPAAARGLPLRRHLRRWNLVKPSSFAKQILLYQPLKEELRVTAYIFATVNVGIAT